VRSQVKPSTVRKLGAVSALACLLVLAYAGSAFAGVGVIGFFGNPPSGPGLIGGEFSTATAAATASPGGVAVNEASGEVYAVDRGNNRVQRFQADGDFISAWGADVISGTASGTGTWSSGSTSVTAVTATAGRFLPGQLISGAGIQPGTRIIQIGGAGATSTLTLTKPTTAEGTSAPLTVAAEPSNVSVNERQILSIVATGGTFKLSAPASSTTAGPQGYAAAPTGPTLAFNATGGEVEAALETIPQIGVGNVAVTNVPGGYQIEFKGTRADSNMLQLTIASSTLSPGGSAVTTTVQGTGFEICAVAAECKPGVAWGTAATESMPGGSLSAPQGVAINQTTGDLYVSNQGLRRMEQFTATGAFVRAWGADVVVSGPEQSEEVQRLTVDATADQYKLNFGSGGPGISQTGDLDWNAGPGVVQAALEGISNIGAGNVTVSGGTGGAGGITPYLIAFTGALANANQVAVTVSAGTVPFSGGASATIATLNDGAVGFETCNVAANCKIGVLEKAIGLNGGLSNPAVIPSGPSAGNVVVGESARRVTEFTATGGFIRAFGWGTIASGPNNTAGNEFEVCRLAALDLCTPLPSAGSGLGQFSNAPGPTRVAADSSGNIYTVEGSANFRVQTFISAPGGGLTPALFNPTIAPPSGEAASPFPLTGTDVLGADSPTEIAVDPSNDHVYVVKACTAAHCPGATFPTERRVYEFTASGTLVTTHLVGYSVGSVNGLAVKAGGKPLYLSTSAPNPGVFIAGDPIPPHLTLAPTTAVSVDTATLNGTVNPEGGGPLHTFYRFEYSPDGGSTWLKAPTVDADVGSGEAPVPVSQTIHGLQPNRDYKVRLVATKGGSPTFSPGSEGDFKTAAAAPRVETFAAFWDRSNPGLVLRAGVNPNNTATTFQFEYGTDPCASSSCQLTPSSSAGAGGQLKEVRATITGLEPETTYHYRAIAENGVDSPTEGEEGTVTTPPAEEACPNEALRTGASAKLPECRAYEWVSAGDTWGTGLAAGVGSIADSGDRAQFFAQTFGQPESSPSPTSPYLTERTPDSGWRVGRALPDPERSSGSFKGEYRLVAADLGAVLWPEATAGERIAGEMNWTVVGIDGSRSPAVAQISPVQGNGAGVGGAAIEYEPVGGAADLSSFVFSLHPSVAAVGMSLFAGEPVLIGNQNSNLYEVSGIGPGPGTLGIVNRGGTVSPENPLGLIGGRCGAGLGGKIRRGDTVRNMARAISADGSVTYFSARPVEPLQGTCTESSPKRLFKRVDHTTTVAVSEPQCSPTPACPGPAGDDEFQSASRDGSVVYFTTPRRLTNSDTDSTADLYVYDSSPPAGEPNLVQASAGGGAEALGVLDAAADGSRVYFAAKGVLSAANAEGVSPVAGQPNLYVYERDEAHPGGRIAFLGTLAQSNDSTQWALGAGRQRSSHALPNQGADADGHLLLFVSGAALLPEDLDAARDLYRYDDSSERLLCLSCMGQEEGADVRIGTRSNSLSIPDYIQAARPASVDGSTVVFITKENLADEDLNGALDVYIWRDGALGLVSAGSGSQGVTLVTNSEGAVESGISPDGKNVFFVTQAALVGADRNNGLDLYDARVGGGFAEAPETPECAGDEGCHGPLRGAPPASGGTGSEAAGPGNPPARKPCAKGKVRRGEKCVSKSRSHKKTKRHRKRGGDERGGKR
jgi:hypothetical protein